MIINIEKTKVIVKIKNEVQQSKAKASASSKEDF
jgi:hypothetical protein